MAPRPLITTMRDARVALGLTQKQMAKVMAVSERQVIRWEKQEEKVRAAVLLSAKRLVAQRFGR